MGRKIKERDIILFNQELVAMIKAGYPILKSLESITARIKNVYLREILIDVSGEVKKGRALSEAFQPYEKLFSPVYTASLMAGEKGGNLPASIGRYIQYAKMVTQTRARIKSAMTYPTVLIVFSFVLMGILINFVIPQFSRFLQELRGRDAGGHPLRHGPGHGPELALVRPGGARRSRPSWRSSGCGAGRISATSSTGSSSACPSAGRSGSSRGSACSAGPSASCSRPASRCSRRSASPSRPCPTNGSSGTCRTSPSASRTAKGLSDALGQSGTFPPLALDMVRIGESSANLQGMLGDMADFYDDRVRGKIETLVTLVEPVVIILMGLAVAAMLLAVYIPIFNIIRIAR